MNPDENGASTSGTNERQGASAPGDQEQGDIDNICLCDCILEESKSCIVKKRGIDNFIAASIKRKDKKDVILRKLKEITVHKTCQNTYVRESSIKSVLKLKADKWRQDREISQDGRHFDFEGNCFLCCTNFKFSRNNIRRVTQQIMIDNIIAQIKFNPPSEINKMILSRLNELKSQTDEYYSENIVQYHSTCLAKFYCYKSNNCQGRPISEGMSDILSFVIDYIVENSEECQFSLKAILQQYIEIHGETDLPRFDRLETLLRKHFQDEIEIVPTTNDRFICFKRTLGNAIEDSWYKNRKSNETEERLRIVKLAVHIMLQDIRAQAFEKDYYNSPTDFLRNATSDIPETLKTFLDILIKTHKNVPKNSSWAKWDNRVTTAAHILMNSVRPRSFSSTVLLGLSCMMHTKFSARGLIDCLYNIGLCASYSETARFESSIVNDPEKFNYISDTYLQFVYDNKATDWGWQIKNNHLIPIGSADPPIPRKLLKQMACSCSKKGCADNSCGCKKAGLQCTDLCAHCNEETCQNLESIDSIVNLDDESLSDEEDNNDVCLEFENFDEDDENDCVTRPKRKKIV